MDQGFGIVAQNASAHDRPQNDSMIRSVKDPSHFDVEVAHRIAQDGSPERACGVERLDAREGIVAQGRRPCEVTHQAMLALRELVEDEASCALDHEADVPVALHGQSQRGGLKSRLLYPACQKSGASALMAGSHDEEPARNSS